MINISESIKKDYISTAALKNFCTNHSLKVSENKAELIRMIVEYAGEDINAEKYQETYQWILKTIKEGSKDLCYKKIYETENIDYERCINSKFGERIGKDLLNYLNTPDFGLVDYNIYRNEYGEVVKVSFLFSKLVLEGTEEGTKGDVGIYPLFIDIYLEEGFIVSRGKAKSTIYEYCASELLLKENKIDTIKTAMLIVNDIVNVFKFTSDDKKVAMSKISKMLYKLYQEYSFVPEDVLEKVKIMEKDIKEFLKLSFDRLDLDYTNMPDALKDLEIFVEKYVSINGDIEHIFKEDRIAYLVKISSNNVEDTTRFDSASAITVPLQCKPLFYDGKKSVTRTKSCKKLHLCYNRKRRYLGNYCAQYFYKEDYGIIKTNYFPEESDIQYVLQTIFQNY